MVFLKHPSHKVADETLTIMNTSLYHEYDVDPSDSKTKLKNLQGFLDELAHRFPPGSPARSRMPSLTSLPPPPLFCIQIVFVCI